MYGRCKNCWWYKLTKNPHYTITSSGLKEFPGEGICYMQLLNYINFINNIYFYCKYTTISWINKIKD